MNNELELPWSGSPSITVALGSIIIGMISIMIVIVGVVYSSVGYVSLIALLGVVVSIRGILKTLSTEYKITSEEVSVKSGVIGKTKNTSKITDIQNTGYNKSIIGTITNKGSVTIEIAGSDDITFKRIPNPQKVRHLLTQQKAKRKDKDQIPGSIETWKQIRDEVEEINTNLS